MRGDRHGEELGHDGGGEESAEQGQSQVTRAVDHLSGQGHHFWH